MRREDGSEGNYTQVEQRREPSGGGQPRRVAKLAAEELSLGEGSLAGVPSQEQRETAHLLQRRGRRGAVLRLDRQHPAQPGRHTLRATLLAAQAERALLPCQPGAAAQADRAGKDQQGGAGNTARAE